MGIDGGKIFFYKIGYSYISLDAVIGFISQLKKWVNALIGLSELI